MAVEKLVLVDHDFGGVARPKNLPAAGSNGEAVRYEEHSEVEANVDDLITLTGVAENATSFGSFTGNTISPNGQLKDILQELSDQAESNQLSVAADSTAFLSIDSNEISISSLAITDVSVDVVSPTLSAWLIANPSNGLEEGDVLVLANAANSLERSYIKNSGTAGDASDYTRLQTDITPANVRGYFSGGDGLAYDNATGVFSANVDDVGLEIDSDTMKIKAAGVKFANVDFGVNAGQIDAGDLPLNTYSWSRITSPQNAEDALQKLDSDISGIIASGNIALNNGVCSDGNNDGSMDVRFDDESIEADGNNKLSIKDQGVQTAMIADANVTLAKMAANSCDSDQYVDESIDFEHISGTAISSDLSSSATSSELARADAVKNYVDGKSYVRKLFAAQSLTANTPASLTHSLGQKYVDVRMFDDATDKEVDFELTLSSSSAISVEVSTSGTYSVLVIG